MYEDEACNTARQDEADLLTWCYAVTTQTLYLEDYSGWHHPPGRQSLGFDTQVVMEALLNQDAGQQIDITDNQVTPVGLVRSCSFCASPSRWS